MSFPWENKNTFTLSFDWRARLSGSGWSMQSKTYMESKPGTFPQWTLELKCTQEMPVGVPEFKIKILAQVGY